MGTLTIFHLKVLCCSSCKENANDSAILAYAMCSQIVKKLISFESSLDCILKQIYINLANGVSTITFYCGKATTDTRPLF